MRQGTRAEMQREIDRKWRQIGAQVVEAVELYGVEPHLVRQRLADSFIFQEGGTQCGLRQDKMSIFQTHVSMTARLQDLKAQGVLFLPAVEVELKWTERSP